MRNKTLAIISVSAGTGHVRAAESLKETAESLYPDVTTVHVDVMEMVSNLFRKLYAGSYIKIIDRHPALWGYLYEKTDKLKNEPSPVDRLRLSIERLNLRKLKTWLKETRPEHIICTHFLPAHLLSRMILKGKYSRPVWLQVTDYDIHALWVIKNITGYFAASEEVTWRMIDRGLEPDRIHVTGIPVMPAFTRPLSRKDCAAQLGVNPEKMTILMMSGGSGVGGMYKVSERVLKVNGDFQLIVLTGKNERLLKDLNELASKYKGRLFPLGFTNSVERVMAVCDLAIIKPGGLSTAECLVMGLPMLLISTVPGQEERNATYLLENGAALKAYDAAGLEYRLYTLLKDRNLLHRMHENVIGLARPDAAQNVIRTVMEDH